MPAKPFEKLKRILAIRLDNIGDVVMTGPALRALHQAFPQAKLTLMASPAGSQVAPLLPWVNDVFPWRAVWQDIARNVAVAPEKERELVQQIEERQFDAAFIFTSFAQSPHPPAYACYMARIPVRVGQSKEFGGGLLTHWVKPLSDDIYQVDRNLYLLNAVGIPAQENTLELQIQPGDQHLADALLADANIPEGQLFIVLAPGASATARRYEETRFAAAARRLVAETGLPVVVVGSQREVGKFPALERLAAQNSRIHSLIGRTTVAEMAAILRQSALLIANNSSAMHIGAAFNRPMVILFAGTERLEQWVPNSSNAIYLNRLTACTPCRRFQCPYHQECLDFSPEQVTETALKLLHAGPPVTPEINPSLASPMQR